VKDREEADGAVDDVQNSWCAPLRAAPQLKSPDQSANVLLACAVVAHTSRGRTAAALLLLLALCCSLVPAVVAARSFTWSCPGE
jgi:hypothetical protein